MTRRSTLAVALLAPALPVLLAAPAQAATHTICVGTPDASWTCDETVTTITQATQAAVLDSQPSTILIGQGPHEVTAAGAQLNGSAVQTVQGSAEGTTLITMADTVGGQGYVLASNGVTLSDVTIQMTGGPNSLNDLGMVLNSGATADSVVVDGSQTQAAQGATVYNATITNSTITLPFGAGGRAVYGQGGSTVTDSTISGDTAFYFSNSAVDTLRRLTIRASYRALIMDAGAMDIDDSVVELTAANASGLALLNDNPTMLTKTVNAHHLTIVGGGANSRGVWARAKNAVTQQNAVVNLDNSIVRTAGGTDLLAEASNTLAAGLTSTASINVSYSDFHSTTSDLGNNGLGGVVQGAGNVDVDPGFVDAASANLHLAAGSGLVDAGDPAAGGPATDRDGNVRIFDGDGDNTARRDMGAYELVDVVAPDTQITSGPSGPTSVNSPTFAFSSEPGATFECRVDAAPFAACSGPGDTHATGALSDGAHTFQVRAVDAVLNTDPSPASRSFIVDTVAPVTTVTSGPAGLVNDATPTFAFSSEPGSTFECRVDAATYAACASPFTTAALSDGAHELTVRAKDAAGNPEASPKVRSFTVDTSGPSTTFTKKPAKRVTTRKVKLVFSSEAGARLECSVDGKAYVPCVSPLKLRVQLGKHVVLVRATDAAGNVGAAVKARFRRVPKA